MSFRRLSAGSRKRAFGRTAVHTADMERDWRAMISHIEETVVVTDAGYRLLSGLPKHLIEVGSA